MIGPGTSTVSAYLAEISRCTAQVAPEAVEEIAALIRAARARGARFYALGNGGSAASASHLACDLGKGTVHGAHGHIRVHSLADNAALITAWANDVDFEQVYSGQLEGLLEPGDVVIALSASGNSPNVVAAVKLARERGATVIGFAGFDGGALAELAHQKIVVPSFDYGVVETVHLALVHALAHAIRAADSRT